MADIETKSKSFLVNIYVLQKRKKRKVGKFEKMFPEEEEEEEEEEIIIICNRVYCIHVPGHDPIIFSFRSFSFLIGWVFYGPNYLRC